MKAKRSWSSVVQTLKDSGCQPRLLYPEKLSITIERQNKIFYDKTRFNQYLTINTTLQKVLEEKLQPKEVATSTETQTIDDLTEAKQRRETHTQ